MVGLDKMEMRRESLIGVAFGGGIGRPSRSRAGGLGFLMTGRLCPGAGKGSESMRIWIRFASVSGSGGSAGCFGRVLSGGSSSSATVLNNFAWLELGHGDGPAVPPLPVASCGWISPRVTFGDEGTPLSAFLSLAPILFNLSPMLSRLLWDELLLTVLWRGSPGVETSTPLSPDGVCRTDVSGGCGEDIAVDTFPPLRVRINR